MSGPRLCSVATCHRAHRSSGFCKGHARRWRATGDPGPADFGPRPGDPCSVDGCARPYRSKGLCDAHYQRLQDSGEPGRAEIAARHPIDPDNPDYLHAHYRVRVARGRADTHVCGGGCGKTAQEWAYDNADPHELTDPKGRPYSKNIEHYRSLCRSCHRRFDAIARLRKRFDFDHCAALYRSGLNLVDVGREVGGAPNTIRRLLVWGGVQLRPNAVGRSRKDQR
jgi:hypothetical protein